MRLYSACHYTFHRCFKKFAHIKNQKQLFGCEKYLYLKCNMSTTPRPTHLEKTLNNKRQDVISQAMITRIADISPSVKEFELQVKDSIFFFKAGQWVDMFIPGVDVVGGFSMCSAPRLLQDSGILHLAVKASRHPPAHWLHTQSKTGDIVSIRAGGDFFYDPPHGQNENDLLLLAGGVGVNPLISILQQFVQQNQGAVQSHLDKSSLSRAVFMYSARNKEELIFKEKLTEINSLNPQVDIIMRCTRDHCDKDSVRYQQMDITKALSNLNVNRTKVYICGPATFIKAMESFCLHSNIPRSSIFYESWW